MALRNTLINVLITLGIIATLLFIAGAIIYLFTLGDSSSINNVNECHDYLIESMNHAKTGDRNSTAPPTTTC